MDNSTQLSKKIIVNKVHIPINITVGRRKVINPIVGRGRKAVMSPVLQQSEKVSQPMQAESRIERGPAKLDMHGCTECGRSFSSSTNLYRHVRIIHKAETFYPKAKMKCCLCGYECLSRKTYDKHVTDSHGVTLLKEEFKFATFEAFETWKKSVERDTQSSFIKKSGTRKAKTFQQVNYYCHRSGSFRPLKVERKRKLKAKGSCKINSTCPSRMMVTINSEVVRVVYHKTHVGHDFDLGHLRLSYEERKGIADKLAENVPFEEILNMFKNSEPERAQLLSRRDLLNIRHEFNLNNETPNTETNAASDEEPSATTEVSEDFMPIILYVTEESPTQELQLEVAQVQLEETCQYICSSDSLEEAKNKLRIKTESLIDACESIDDCQVLQQLFVNSAVVIEKNRQRRESDSS